MSWFRRGELRPQAGAIAAAVEAYVRWSNGYWVVMPIVLGVAVVVVFSLLPATMAMVVRALERLAKANNAIVLGVFFFLVLTPIGFVTRKLGGSRFHSLQARQRESYWQARADHGKEIDFTKMY